MPNATQGTIKDGTFTTLTLIGQIPSTNFNTGSLQIKSPGGLSIETGSAYVGGNIYTTNVVQTGAINVLDGAVPGYILRGKLEPVGQAYWDRDGDDRIFGDYGGDLNFQFGSFGIGISYPLDMLHVKENIRTDQNINFTNPASNIEFPGLLTMNTNQYYFGATATLGLGIGTTATQPLDVVGNVRLSGNLMKEAESYVLPTLGYSSDILVAVTLAQTIYNKTLDYPDVQGNIDLQNTGRIINVNDPVYLQDVATKSYVDTFIQGLDPQESVKDKDLQIPPISPADKDRYIVAVGATGAWAGQDNKIAEYDLPFVQWIFITPDHGTMTLVEDENKKYVYNGSSWILFDTLVNHSELQNLDKDDHPQYQLLGGREGGQALYGGTAPNDDLFLYSTSDPTRGFVIIQPDDGFVSIGTTNPTELLHVQSQDGLESVILIDTRNTTTNSKLVLQNNNDISTAWEIMYQASSDDFVIRHAVDGERLIIENGPSGAIRFNSGGNEWARFDGGYLGIGTTSPSERLTVGNLDNELNETILVQANNNAKLTLSSNISNTNDADTSYVEFTTKNATKSSIIGLVGTDGQFATNTHQDALFLGAGASGIMTDIQFATNDEVRLTIKELGNVGINNDEPNALLTINDNLDAHNGLTLGATTDIGIKIGQNTTNYIDIFWNFNLDGNVAYSEITNKTSVNDLVLQSTGGSVGIGVTQPQDRLDINGNVRISGTVNRGTEVFTLPLATDTLLGRISTDNVENKQLKDETVYFVNNDDLSKKLQIDLADATPSTGTTFRFIQTVDRILTFPDNNDTIVGVSTPAHLSNKDLSSNVMTDLISGSGTVTFPAVTVAGDTVAYLNATQSMYNKTLVEPTIAGTLTQTEGSGIITDRIQAINQNGIVFLDSSGLIAFSLTDGGLLGVGVTNALADFHVVGEMTRIDSNFQVNTNTLYVAVTSTNVGINTNDPQYDLDVVGTGHFTSDVTIDGNLFVNGTQTVINTSIVAIEDSLAKYADGNVADTLDIGFYANYVETGVTKMTGFFRDATDKRYRLFTGLEVEPAENIINVEGTGYTKAELVLGTLNTDNINHDSDMYFNSTQGVLTSTGSLGLLTTSPNETLHVNGTVQLGTQFYVKNGNVGVHNSNPVNELDIYGSTRLTGSASSALAGTVDPDGTTTLTGTSTLFLSQIVVGDRITIGAETRTVTAIASDTSLTVNSAFSDVAPTTATRVPAIMVFEDSSNVLQVLVRENGFVGIGTNSVSYPLHVERQNTSNWSAKYQNGESTVFIGHDLGLGMNIQTGTISDTSYALKVSNNTYPLLRLQNDNKLGIGTDTPAELLHVQGTAIGDGALIGNAKIGVWEGNTAYTALTHNDVHATSTSYAVKQHNTGETTLNSAATKDLRFAINDVEEMVLKPSGRLGIGTNAPTDMLHVWGGSMVTGNLHVSGDLIIDGVIDSVSTTEIRVSDSMLKFADGNTADLIDIGIYAQYNDGVDKYTGLIRNDADKKWYLFDGLEVEPGTTQMNDSHPSFGYGDLVTGNLEIRATTGTTGSIYFINDAGDTMNEIVSTQDSVTFGTSGTFNFSSPQGIIMAVDSFGNMAISGTFNVATYEVINNFSVLGNSTLKNLDVYNVRFGLINITDDITVGATYNYYIADATGGDIIITLPESHDASNPSFIGYSFNFVKTDNSTNNVIVKTSGSDIIDGSSTQYVMTRQYERLKLCNIGGGGSVGLWFSE